MAKRHHDELYQSPPPKRLRITQPGSQVDFITSLSNEILLHILSFLPLPDLLTCQRLSYRFRALAVDSEIWKRQYFTKWVRPRARLLASSRRTSLPPSRIEYSPRVSTWLDHNHLDKKDGDTNWKRQYQLRHNWSKGACRVTRVQISQRRPPMLVTLCAGYVFTADSCEGLRVWSVESPGTCKAAHALVAAGSQPLAAPTALTATCGPEKNCIEIAIGFDDGVLSVYKLDMVNSRLIIRSSRNTSTQGAVTAMAASYPYVMVVSEHMLLSLYKLPSGVDDHEWGNGTHLIASLKADNILAPISLSVRLTGSVIVASIIYSFLHIGCGWSLGIQEVHFDKNGQQTESRLTTTVDTQYGVGSNRLPQSTSVQIPVSIMPTILHRDPPTSVSYSHPYLLTSHADNTLTVFLVVSTPNRLFVKGGRKLWGHTSSVSAAQVSDRGKAVSVSSHGDEVRIWELETLVSSLGSQRMLHGDSSIKVKPETQQRIRDSQDPDLLSGLLHRDHSQAESPSVSLPPIMTKVRDCIGFDDERLLLLREKECGPQLLEFYDFR
ncbi:hypothetical protein BDW74DRAFT_188755 [Aspergillus multicolor]|uniref:WD domain protein n=1 Tax=Aspergillus multicolor TaxID=41759 RepID=UPI003CCD0056